MATIQIMTPRPSLCSVSSSSPRIPFLRPRSPCSWIPLTLIGTFPLPPLLSSAQSLPTLQDINCPVQPFFEPSPNSPAHPVGAQTTGHVSENGTADLANEDAEEGGSLVTRTTLEIESILMMNAEVTVENTIPWLASSQRNFRWDS